MTIKSGVSAERCKRQTTPIVGIRGRRVFFIRRVGASEDRNRQTGPVVNCGILIEFGIIWIGAAKCDDLGIAIAKKQKMTAIILKLH